MTAQQNALNLLDLSEIEIQPASTLYNAYKNIDIRNGLPQGYFETSLFTLSPLSNCPIAYEALADFEIKSKWGARPIIRRIARWDELDQFEAVLEGLNAQANKAGIDTLLNPAELDERLRPSVLRAAIERSMDDADLAHKLARLFDESPTSANRALLSLRGFTLAQIRRIPVEVCAALVLSVSEQWYRLDSDIAGALSVRVGQQFSKLTHLGAIELAKLKQGRKQLYLYAANEFAKALSVLMRRHADPKPAQLLSLLESLQPIVFFALMNEDRLRSHFGAWLICYPQHAKRLAKCVATAILEREEDVGAWNTLQSFVYAVPELGDALPRTFLAHVKKTFPLQTYKAVNAGLQDQRFVSAFPAAVGAIEPRSLFGQWAARDLSHRQIFDFGDFIALVTDNNHPLALIKCTRLTQLCRLLGGSAHKHEVALMTRVTARYPMLKSLFEHAFYVDGKIDRHGYLEFLAHFNELKASRTTLEFLARLLPEHIAALSRLDRRHKTITGQSLMERIIASEQPNDTFNMAIEVANNERLVENYSKYIAGTGYPFANLHDYFSGALARADLLSSKTRIAQEFSVPKALVAAAKKVPELQVLTSDQDLKSMGRSYRFCLGSQAYIQAGFHGDRFIRFIPSEKTLKAFNPVEPKVVAKGLVAHCDPGLTHIKQIKGFANRNPSRAELEHFKALVIELRDRAHD